MTDHHEEGPVSTGRNNYQDIHNALALATSPKERRDVATEALGKAQAAILVGLVTRVDQDDAQQLVDDLVHAVATNLRVAPAQGYRYRTDELLDLLADGIEPYSFSAWAPDESLTPKVFTATLTFESVFGVRWAKRYIKELEDVRTVHRQRSETLFVTGEEEDVRKTVEAVEAGAARLDPPVGIAESLIEEGLKTSFPGRTEREGTWAYKALLRFGDEQTAKWAQKAAQIARPDFTLKVQYISLAMAGPDMDSVTEVALDLKQRFRADVELWQGKELATRRKWGL